MALPNALRTSSGNVRRASRAAGWNLASFPFFTVPDLRPPGKTRDGVAQLRDLPESWRRNATPSDRTRTLAAATLTQKFNERWPLASSLRRLQFPALPRFLNQLAVF